jgi:D-alanine--D-alanine ligase
MIVLPVAMYPMLFPPSWTVSMTEQQRPLRLAVLCGGPSPERGISLNSVRSVCDHLEGDDMDIVPVYFDLHTKPYLLSRGQLYSNTPSDFDFKLRSTAEALSDRRLRALLKGVDLAFPVMHGKFGEDGGIQSLLEGLRIPFVGSDAAACKRCFDKYDANEYLRSLGFYTLPSIKIERNDRDIPQRIVAFFTAHQVQRAAVKPAVGGSSIGVFSVETVHEAVEKVAQLFADQFYERVVVEQFATGTEFTAVLLENRFGMPVCLLPVEIEADYTQHQIFDFRKKYLPTRQVTYYCPPRFDNEDIERIQMQAQQLFVAFGLQDFARFDGWLREDGNLWFSDFNPVSGMEQNSFLFLQAAHVGMSHRDVLRFIVRRACQRYSLAFGAESRAYDRPRQRLHVLFGGNTAERQVSLMSGTNVWLKLRRSTRYDPRPYLLDAQGLVWELPYALTLNHTVEEIAAWCRRAARHEARLALLKQRVVERLAPLPGQLTEPLSLPRRLSLQQFVKESPCIFIALHGGMGEDGTLQQVLEDARVRFNGSGAQASRLCMDKYATGKAVEALGAAGILTAKKRLLPVKPLARYTQRDYEALWAELVQALQAPSLIVKPPDDGCSAGIMHLRSPQDLETYVTLLLQRVPRIPGRTFAMQRDMVEMPVRLPRRLLFEQFIATDRVRVEGHNLVWQHVSGWIEVTVGVLGKRHHMRALNPSITVALGDVLTVEEKFQGGTGVNVTPPPPEYVSPEVLTLVKRRIETVANALDLAGYARIDCFIHISTGEVIVIEVNTLPALTPSTVLFHQALAEPQPLYPKEFLERVLEVSGVALP